MTSKNIVRVRLVSTGKTKEGKKTGTFYARTKSKKGDKANVKLLLKKFDPRAFNAVTGKNGMHVEFKEEKMK